MIELKKTLETLQQTAGFFSEVCFSLVSKSAQDCGLCLTACLFIQLVEELKAECQGFAAVWALFAELCDISHM